MKHILTFLFCIGLLTGCTHGRHEALADGHVVNDGKAPQQTVSINNLYPGELPDTGKVTTYHGPAPRVDSILDNTYYRPYRKYYNNKYRYRRYTPRRRY